MKDFSQQERRKQYSMVDTQPNDDGTDDATDIVEAKELEGSVVCSECGVQGPGIISSEIPIAVYAIVLILIIVIGKWAFVIAPFLFLLINSQIRTCSSCGHVIEQKLQFSVKSVNEQVYTMKFSGDLVIVISKRYSMIIGSVLLLLFLSIFTYEEFFAGSGTSQTGNFNVTDKIRTSSQNNEKTSTRGINIWNRAEVKESKQTNSELITSSMGFTEILL